MAATLGQSFEWMRNATEWVGNVVAGGAFWGGVLFAVSIGAIASIAYHRRHQTSSVTISLPFGLGSVTYENSAQDRVLAWQMYVQLKTRKAALPFDDRRDVIADVYASLYELAGVTRELLLVMSLSDLQRPKGVSELVLRVLNDGIRPHLTRWQAAFRSWWDQQISDQHNRGKDPREIQRQYPHYAALVQELKRTNTELSKFAEELLLIARSDRRTLAKRAKAGAKPIAPVSSAAPPAKVESRADAQSRGEAFTPPDMPYTPAPSNQRNSEREELPT